MPLRDIRQYHHWVERERPSRAAQDVARYFLLDVGHESWRYPSTPIDALSAQPEYEVREASLAVADEPRPIHLWYRHFYADDAVDVIAVTNR